MVLLIYQKYLKVGMNRLKEMKKDLNFIKQGDNIEYKRYKEKSFRRTYSNYNG